MEHIRTEKVVVPGGSEVRILAGEDSAPNLHRHYVYSVIAEAGVGVAVHQTTAHFPGSADRHQVKFVDPAIHAHMDKVRIKNPPADRDQDYVRSEVVVQNFAAGTAREVEVEICVL